MASIIDFKQLPGQIQQAVADIVSPQKDQKAQADSKAATQASKAVNSLVAAEEYFKKHQSNNALWVEIAKHLKINAIDPNNAKLAVQTCYQKANDAAIRIFFLNPPKGHQLQNQTHILKQLILAQNRLLKEMTESYNTMATTGSSPDGMRPAPSKTLPSDPLTILEILDRDFSKLMEEQWLWCVRTVGQMLIAPQAMSDLSRASQRVQTTVFNRLKRSFRKDMSIGRQIHIFMMSKGYDVLVAEEGKAEKSVPEDAVKKGEDAQKEAKHSLNDTQAEIKTKNGELIKQIKFTPENAFEQYRILSAYFQTCLVDLKLLKSEEKEAHFNALTSFRCTAHFVFLPKDLQERLSMHFSFSDMIALSRVSKLCLRIAKNGLCNWRLAGSRAGIWKPVKPLSLCESHMEASCILSSISRNLLEALMFSGEDQLRIPGLTSVYDKKIVYLMKMFKLGHDGIFESNLIEKFLQSCTDFQKRQVHESEEKVDESTRFYHESLHAQVFRFQHASLQASYEAYQLRLKQIKQSENANKEREMLALTFMAEQIVFAKGLELLIKNIKSESLANLSQSFVGFDATIARDLVVQKVASNPALVDDIIINSFVHTLQDCFQPPEQWGEKLSEEFLKSQLKRYVSIRSPLGMDSDWVFNPLFYDNKKKPPLFAWLGKENMKTVQRLWCEKPGLPSANQAFMKEAEGKKTLKSANPIAVHEIFSRIYQIFEDLQKTGKKIDCYPPYIGDHFEMPLLIDGLLLDDEQDCKGSNGVDNSKALARFRGRRLCTVDKKMRLILVKDERLRHIAEVHSKLDEVKDAMEFALMMNPDFLLNETLD